MTQHEGRFNFGPASPKEKIVFGAERPGRSGYNSKSVPRIEVQEWIDFMKKQGIKRICCLLPENQLSYYDDIDLLKLYIEKFGEENIFGADIEDFHLCDKDKLIKEILPFLIESEQKGKVVVHCSGGIGRTGHVLAAWLVHRHGLSVEEAISTVRRMGREPCEAVFAKKATEDELINLLEACKSDLHKLNSLLQNFLNYVENNDIINAMIMIDGIIRQSQELHKEVLINEPSDDKKTYRELAKRFWKIRDRLGREDKTDQLEFWIIKVNSYCG